MYIMVTYDNIMKIIYTYICTETYDYSYDFGYGQGYNSK